MIKAKKLVAWVCAAAMLAGSITTIPNTGDAAKKKVKLSRTRATVAVGKTIKISLKNGKKKGKVTWKSSKKKYAKIVKKNTKGNKAFANVKGVKKGKSVITAVYKLGKSKKTLKCTVNVSNNPQTPSATQASQTVTQGPAATSAVVTQGPAAPTAVPTATPEPFNIVDNSKASAMLYIDPKDSEYDGISIIAEAFKADVARVSGIGTDDEGVANESPNGLQVVTDKSAVSGRAIIAGTVGANGNDLIKQLVSDGKLDVSDIEGKWETYKLQVIKNPVVGVDEALVVAGSDKRGTIYGIFRLSELMGVSPWVWWADATPAVRAKVDLDGAEINKTSKEPSVKYRGIFLNDESPSLTNWSNNKYGQRNYKFYAHVFELILRLKGDYLWPAMWGNAFSKDGVSSVKGGVDPEYEGDTLANAKLADKYGIVMGTSHHEPCYRAGNEWGNEYSKYKGSISDSSANAWNKYNLPSEAAYDERINTAIEKFWDDGVKRNGAFDNICTVGMRGENDSSLPAADDPPKYAELLNHIINQQKDILANNGDTNPTQLVVYKEVENAWNEGALYEQDCMKDTIAMLCDDNWAYVRTLPTYEQQQMVGGLGMYYHFDYVGAPKSYTWIQTTQISRIWDQMSVSYDYGIDDVWVVNVGDLKPMEMDISYFLDLGYDYEKWGVNGNSKLAEYKEKWFAEQFGKSGLGGLDKEQLAEASRLMDDYLDLETSRKVEHVLYNTANNCSDMFSVNNYNEAQDILMKCNDIMNRAEDLKAKVPEDLQAAFYQLIYYPAMAVPNVLKIEIYAALNNKYSEMGLTAANKYRELCQQAIDLDNELYDTFNNNMPGAPENGKKWRGMQSADQKYHIGMQQWNTDSGQLPSLKTVNGSGSAGLNVLVESITGSMTKAYTDGEAELPGFTSTNNEVYTIELANKGTGSYDYTAKASADWIVLSKASGTVNELDAIHVYIDWSKLTATASGSIEISDGSNTVKVNVYAEKVATEGLADKTYIMANEYASIDVANYTDIKDGKGITNAGKESDNKMIVVPDNGKYLTAVRTTSSTITYDNAAALANAPYVEYTVSVPQDDTYTLDCQFNPTSNLEYNNMQLRYGISIDGGDIKITNSIVDNYLAGTWSQGTWATDIEKNGRTSKISGIHLTPGVHKIRYYQCDPNMALIRLVLHQDDLASVYNAPAESYYVGKKVDVSSRLYDKILMY